MNLFGANTPVIDEFFVMPVISHHSEIMRLLAEAGVNQTASIVSGKAVMDFSGTRRGVALLGVETPSYFSIFPGIELLKGEFLDKNNHGVMLSREIIDSIEDEYNTKVKVGSPVKFTVAYGNGFRIREVPLTGIYQYENPGPYMDQVVLIDPQTLRSLSSVLNVTTDSFEVEDDALSLLNDDMDNLFMGSDFFGSETEDAFTIADLENDLATKKETPKTIYDGDWNFILIRTGAGQNASRLQAKLIKLLEPYGVSVVDWRTAAGSTAMSVLFIQFFFYGGILLISIAGIISIVNIMLISVFRRTREIGTLRAIGASDVTIAGLILLENFILSLVAGIIGITFAWLCICILNNQSILIGNNLIASLFGSQYLHIELLALEAVKSLTVAVVLGLLSGIYPGLLAIKINPIEAVRRG